MVVQGHLLLGTPAGPAAAAAAAAAGATAVPLAQPGHQVMFVPTPAETITEFGDRPGNDAGSSSSHENASAVRPGIRNGSMGNVSGTSSGLTVTASGTPAVAMKPLPDVAATASGISNGSFGLPTAGEQGYGTRNRSEGFHQERHPPPSPPAAQQTSELRRRHPKQLTAEQQAAASSYNSPAGAIAAALHDNHHINRWQGQSPFVTEGCHHQLDASADKSFSNSSSRGMLAKAARWWQWLKVKMQDLLVAAGEQLLEWLVVGFLWLLQLLTVPVMAVFGPWYLGNR
jgi:hypothetical protein